MSISPMTAFRRARLMLALLAIAAGTPARAQSSAAPLTNTEAFRAAFGLTFKGFDACGDTVNGERYRKAVTEKLDSCPFTPDAKAKFHAWAETTTQRFTAQLQRFIVENKKLLARCEPQKRDPAYVILTDLLSRYSRGEVGIDAIISDPCDVRPAAP